MSRSPSDRAPASRSSTPSEPLVSTSSVSPRHVGDGLGADAVAHDAAVGEEHAGLAVGVADHDLRLAMIDAPGLDAARRCRTAPSMSSSRTLTASSAAALRPPAPPPAGGPPPVGSTAVTGHRRWDRCPACPAPGVPPPGPAVRRLHRRRASGRGPARVPDAAGKRDANGRRRGALVWTFCVLRLLDRIVARARVAHPATAESRAPASPSVEGCEDDARDQREPDRTASRPFSHRCCILLSAPARASSRPA